MSASGAPSDDILRGIQQNIQDAISILQVSEMDEGQCEADVRHRIGNIYNTWKDPPSNPKLRKDLEAASGALRKVARLVPGCFEDIHGHIADATAYIAFHVDRLKASQDSGPKTKIPKTKVEVPLNTRAKYAAASEAHYLIRHWSAKAPTQTSGGPFSGWRGSCTRQRPAMKPTTTPARASTASAARSSEIGTRATRLSAINPAAANKPMRFFLLV